MPTGVFRQQELLPMAKGSDENLSKDRALEILRSEQARWRAVLRVRQGIIPESIRELTLKAELEHQHAGRPVGDYLFYGVFKYPAELEKARWQLTIDLINRFEPGPDEKPHILALLARQAASIEFVLGHPSPTQLNQKMIDQCSRIILGTTWEPFFQGFSFKRPTDEYALVLLSSGLIEFIYQSAKAVVLSWKRSTPPKGGGLSFKVHREDVQAVLAADPYPLKLFSNILCNYFFSTGFPRPTKSQAPPPEYHPPLSLLIGFAERFVIGHEYGHALMHQLAPIALPSAASSLASSEASVANSAAKDHNVAWVREFEADIFAFSMVTQSGRILDAMPPNMALQGGLFVLHAMEVLREVRTILATGTVPPDLGTNTHPSNTARIEVLKAGYRQVKGSEPDESIQGALAASDTLMLLWERTKPKFVRYFKSRRELHPIWTTGPSGFHR